MLNEFKNCLLLLLGRILGKKIYATVKYNIKCEYIFCHILDPLAITMSIIIEHKDFDTYIDILRESLPDSLKHDSTIDDIYNILKEMPQSDVMKLLRKISPDYPSSESLALFFNNNDKKHFRETLLNENYNLQELKEICDYYVFRIQNFKMLEQISDKKTDREMVMLKAENIINDLSENKDYRTITDLLKQIKEVDIFEEKISQKKLYHYAKGILYLYFIFMDKYTTFEEKNLNKYIKKIKRDPYCRKVYDKIYSMYQKEMREESNNTTESQKYQEIGSDECTETDSETPKEITSDKASETDDENNNEDFFLDKDYFNQQPVPDQNAYFCKLKECVKAGEGTKFMEFINWLAKEGYIENTPETKATFAFRLTGICPPENLVEKIEWKKGVNEMAYIIRYFYPQTTKWSKIKIFFTSSLPNFDQQTSSYADNVDPTFEKDILGFYPNIKKN